ncbi:hypothetical protein L202_05848 [Cryptococcus amylolentus CBS 6039]|uniref:Erythromycin biosynthesis protein CIII-like C-terminal domain-containing protein n=2 Tax=Cryptococcus amylolentus TaxID=104669 RepID=A0A1E3HJF2_9TREE|nr:hypothetical protein L202_05848 [Cryptococcus amylolentus CBS 6039]ODN75856.1 hypothetical protein L202_05848 [Cryptococcus amylolentus CBS 6039]ODN97009.1 hypothetical protein I350_07987 [Cryptococcus amylolentus CBS 6273]
MSSDKRPSLLFLTSPEHGQANCQFAVITCLREHYGDDIDIHLCSYPELENRTLPSVTFHSVKGEGIVKYFEKITGSPKAGLQEAFKTISSPTGFLPACMAYPRLLPLLHPESPEEYVASANDVAKILADVNPDFIVCDDLFDQARDAIINSGRKFILISPNTIKEVAGKNQGLGRLWKWPALVSGYAYPVPWHLIPLNIVATIFPLFYFRRYERFLTLIRTRNAAGYPDLLPKWQANQTKYSKIMCMSTPEAEIPAVYPPGVICCGPILQHSKPLQEVNEKMYEWVMAKPTVLIVLGSHFVTSEEYANKVMAALNVLLDARPDIQVLWKVRKDCEFEIAGWKEKEDRVKVVQWLEADPIAILETGNIVCFVNHGGSNSYHEALQTGTPQIILAAWVDCYDFATRLEYLGNGAWGNKGSAPGCDTKTLTKALLKVIGATPDAAEATKIWERAAELKEIVTDGGRRIGREVAAGYVWEGLQEALRTYHD